jgi:hypothetical protein
MDAPALANEAMMIDVNTASFEEIEALPGFIREKMQSSDEFKGRVKHAENMRGGTGAPTWDDEVVEDEQAL